MVQAFGPAMLRSMRLRCFQGLSQRCRGVVVGLGELHQEQRVVAEEVLKGRNVFLTGLPGTGKSFLIKSLVQQLQHQKGRAAVGVCGSTGVAGLRIQGSTVHSLLGCGLGESEADWQRARKIKGSLSRLRALEVLFIDEVSMLSADFLDEASSLLGHARRRPEPFGGVQVVLSGDFLQLRPVQGDMAFEAKCWPQLQLRSLQLRTNFRQQDEPFQALLQRVRLGEVPQQLQVAKGSGKGAAKGAPVLVSTNKEAEAENTKYLAALDGEEHVFKAVDKAETPAANKALSSLVTERVLRLKVGAKVMLLENKHLPNKHVPKGKKLFSMKGPLVNGSMGVVSGFKNHEGVAYPIVDFGGERVHIRASTKTGELGHHGTYSRTQVPLKLAWALTVHKTQGLTLEAGEVRLPRIFAPRINCRHEFKIVQNRFKMNHHVI